MYYFLPSIELLCSNSVGNTLLRSNANSVVTYYSSEIEDINVCIYEPHCTLFRRYVLRTTMVRTTYSITPLTSLVCLNIYNVRL